MFVHSPYHEFDEDQKAAAAKPLTSFKKQIAILEEELL